MEYLARVHMALPFSSALKPGSFSSMMSDPWSRAKVISAATETLGPLP